MHSYRSLFSLFSVATVAATAAHAPALPSHAAAGRAVSVASLTSIAQSRYDIEAQGAAAQTQLRRVARDPVLLAALQAGNTPRVLAEATRLQGQLVQHISRLRISVAGHKIVDVGVPFCVAGPHTTLLAPDGSMLGTLEISIQDEIGFMRYMHHNYPVDIFLRGASGQTRTSLPAAAHVTLPATGKVTIAGRRYNVRSFSRMALDQEPVTVWVLARV